MENSIKSASLEPKKTFKLPAGAVIIKKGSKNKCRRN